MFLRRIPRTTEHIDPPYVALNLPHKFVCNTSVLQKKVCSDLLLYFNLEKQLLTVGQQLFNVHVHIKMFYFIISTNKADYQI